jgi:putative spermidine/putrescine transport system permease protein
VAAVIRNRTFRYVTLTLLGLYVIIPMYASVQFSLESGYHSKLTFAAYSQGLAQPGLGTSVITSLEVSFGAVAATLVLLVPTIIFVNLRLPSFRSVLEAVSLLPLGIPAIVTVVGTLGVYSKAPTWFIGSPLILALLYVTLALPYSYRAIDSGVRSIDLRTLVEAGRSMGAGWGVLFRRVLFPNLRSGILAAAFLTLALSLGEYTFASLILPSTPTFPVWLASVVTTSTYYAVALSVIALIVTWGLLVAMSVVGSGRRRGAGADADVAGGDDEVLSIAPALQPAEPVA